MKQFQEETIRRSEVGQLILLHCIYSQPGSEKIFFQGGTAIRWCYGGPRFSEDLDFVTPLEPALLDKIMRRAFKSAAKEMLPHFGAGAAEITTPKARPEARKYFFRYAPDGARRKLAVKVELEGIHPDLCPRTQNHVMSGLPAVAYSLAQGSLRIPHPNAVIVSETREEILSDKVRALLERPYLKGRDIFDVWYVKTMLGVEVNREIIARKLQMYRWPFRAARQPDFFIEPTPEARQTLTTAIAQDLSRFLPAATLAVLFTEVKDMGILRP
jgi:predicted nucleotidyltransferase component of viral defense system